MVDRIEVERVLWEIAEDIEKIMTRYQALASTVTLKVKFHDFQTVTRSFSPDYPIHRATEIVKLVDTLVTKTEVGKKRFGFWAYPFQLFPGEGLTNTIPRWNCLLTDPNGGSPPGRFPQGNQLFL